MREATAATAPAPPTGLVATDVPETLARMTRVAWPPSVGSTAPGGQARHTRRDARAKAADVSCVRDMRRTFGRRLDLKACNFRTAVCLSI